MRLFNTVTIQTPESVELEFTLAGIGNRVLALIIDYALIAVAQTIVLLLGLSLISSQITDLDSLGTSGLWILAITILMLFAIYSGYFIGFEAWWQGQTPGKRFVKIRVVKDNGKPEGVFQATLRALMRPVDDILFIGYLCILFGPKEKRIGDWLAGTLVIQAERPVNTATLSVPESSQTIAEQLMGYASIGNLLPDDFAVLREYLQRRTTLTQQARQALSVKLADQVREIIKLEKVPQIQIPADPFLEAVYWAYQEQFSDRRKPN